MAKKQQVNTEGVEVEVEVDEASQTEVVEAVDTVGATTAEPTTVDAPVVEEESTDGLVKVSKGDQSLFVHPTTVDAHAAAGWKT